mmetsp:Transcript_13918/g.27812  ORF Transcript_13918/g.27812 Transcript_13918/m.27812 type:complete len:200 (+) Transcript_13918:424-1023(+)
MNCVTFVYSVDLSSGHRFLLHVVCTTAARNVSGMDSPDNHMTTGSPSETHLVYCSCRLSQNMIQFANPFRVAGVSLSHCGGSNPLRSARPISSSSALMPSSPLRARCRSRRERVMYAFSEFQRSSSCNKTIWIGDGVPSGLSLLKVLRKTGTSNSSGILLWMSDATFAMMSSELSPPSPPPRGCIDTRPCHSSFVESVI